MLYKLADGRQLDDVLKAIASDRVVYACEQSDEEQYHLVRAESWDPSSHTLGAYRPIEPLKSIVFRPREFLGALGTSGETPSIPEQVVFGVKNCDLSALRIHDYVLRDTEPVDPLYMEARAKTLIVSADCTGCLDVCFCPVVGEQPHPKEGFDINISNINGHYLVETGSERGEAALAGAKDALVEADDEFIKQRDGNRDAMYKRVTDQAAEMGLKPGADLRTAIAGSFESELWDDFAKDCVECGACNFCCCTCHCFLLADGMAKTGSPARVKEWDSCLFKNFARVAGGANPRSHRAERLLNRFDKKFNFFPEILDGMYACDGCGRCVEACTGRIDIREVLKRALDESNG